MGRTLIGGWWLSPSSLILHFPRQFNGWSYYIALQPLSLAWQLQSPLLAGNEWNQINTKKRGVERKAKGMTRKTGHKILAWDTMKMCPAFFGNIWSCIYLEHNSTMIFVYSFPSSAKYWLHRERENWNLIKSYTLEMEKS